MSAADPAQDHQDALDAISRAFAQIRAGLSLLRDEARSIAGAEPFEEQRLIFLVDALEGLACAGSAAFDRVERAL